MKKVIELIYSREYKTEDREIDQIKRINHQEFDWYSIRILLNYTR